MFGMGVEPDKVLNNLLADIARRILTEINSRIQFLLDVGLGYLDVGLMKRRRAGSEVF